MVGETSTSLFARVSFAGAECGLQSRSGLAAESFDSTSLATRFLPTTTPTTATRDDGARARGRRRRMLRRRARERCHRVCDDARARVTSRRRLDVSRRPIRRPTKLKPSPLDVDDSVTCLKRPPPRARHSTPSADAARCRKSKRRCSASTGTRCARCRGPIARRTPRVEPRARLAPPSALGSIHAPARLTARE